MNKTRLLWGILLILAILLTGCGDEKAADPAGTAAGGTNTTSVVPSVLSQEEYLLYENIFYDGYGDQFEGKSMVKNGVYAALQDAFNGRTRYYVWGYLDNTKCCDWQWEFVPADPQALPVEGSLVTVTGTFRSSEEALDGYWLENASVKTESTYTGSRADLNMRAMSCTLERVQMFNILYQPDTFEGKSFNAYGRIAGANLLQDPYYNGSWQISFTADAQAPAIGTLVELRGQVTAGTLTDCALAVTP